jgi:hypothetical protein
MEKRPPLSTATQYTCTGWIQYLHVKQTTCEGIICSITPAYTGRQGQCFIEKNGVCEIPRDDPFLA